MKGMTIMFIVLIISFAIAGAWDKIPAIKNSVHFILDPSAGWLLNWNITLGMIIIVIIFSFLTILAQKYGTDQAELKRIKAEQKILQEEAKKYKDHPEKLLELNKKQLEFVPKTMDLTMKPMIYTFIPFILFFRWFNDYFSPLNYKFFGFLSWIWFYIILSIILSSILRKVLKVA